MLLDWSSDAALADRLWKSRAFDDGYRVMAMNWYGKNRPDAARTMALSVIAHPDSEPLRIAAIRVLGQVKEASGSHDVYDALVAVANENSYGARAAAVTALGQVGNKAAIPLLTKISEHAPNGIEGAAKAALKALGVAGN